MSLIAILISILAVRTQWVPTFISERLWAEQYCALVARRRWFNRRQPAVQYGALVLPPLLILWYLGVMANGWAFELANFLVAVFLLVSVLSYRSIESALQPFLRRWRNQEWQAAYEHGAQFFHYSKMISPNELLNQTITQYLLKVNQFLFAPVFWFALFGTAGLSVYVLTLAATHVGLLERNSGTDNAPWRQLAREFLNALDGVPARCVALSVALLSLNTKALAVSVRRFRVTDREAEIVLKLSVKMALDFQDLADDNEAIASEGVSRIHAVQDLRTNVLMLWLLIMAFFTLLGWIF